MIYINAESTRPNDLRTELEALGFEVTTSRLGESWQGRPPETLVIARNTDLMSAHVRGLERIARDHNQDCIAIRLVKGVGVTVGSKPVPYKEEFFNLV